MASSIYAPPTEQFLSKYVVYVPDTWLKDYLVITKLVGKEVNITGSDPAHQPASGAVGL